MHQTCSCSVCTAAPAPKGFAGREAPFTTHDGVIWPTARRAMADPRQIRRRMSGDLAALIRDAGSDVCITPEDLARIGWQKAQIREHGAAAVRLATEARADG